MSRNLTKIIDGIAYPLTADEIAQHEANETLEAQEYVNVIASDVRGKRNELLSASDWTMASDAPVDRDAWSAYRQALRDVPQQAGFPININWPTPPA